MKNEELLYAIALSFVPGLGPKKAKLCVSYCGSAKAVFEASKSKLLKAPGIGAKTVEFIQASDTIDRATKNLEFIEKIGAHAVHFYEDAYPQRLKHFDSSPLVLYYKGNMMLNHPRTVAIIGTRQPTEQGKIICEKIIKGLQPYDVQIISGLAYGVDTCAHKSAVDQGIPTIGVLGHGLDQLYPAENRPLSQKMIKNGGVLTEFSWKSSFDKENFPMRNRIIASMSDVVIVVESKRKGGSIITAEFANEYNKDVFAVPGRITDEVSEGCNNLIKQHKAYLLSKAEDIAYIMRWDEIDKQKTVQKSLFVELNKEEQIVVDYIKKQEGAVMDELSQVLKMPSSQVASTLLNLEFKGVIKALPGKRFILA